ncbi:MAG TPA: ABC transporter permease [Streptosporangiaceae bacterium]|nr:ABC transporter permease [Streptosporangiaceae bacterium]
MTKYLVRRVSQSVAVLFIVTVVVFSILHFLPGSPARAMLGIRATPGAIAAFNKANGYNRALPVQYLLYIDRLVHGNLGFSYHFDQSVNSLLALDLPKSTVLVGASYVLALLIAIPMGIWQALRREKVMDHALTAFSFVGYAMPTFWLGILLVVWFSADLHLFPSEGPQGATVGAALSNPSALVLPVATLTIVTVAQFSRFMRASAVENLLQDYIRTAKAKGLSNWRMVTRHLLRNSILPIITLVGLSLPGVLSGAIIVEALFNYPGMGWLFWTATGAHDFPVLMGFTIVVAVATVAGNLLADIAYAVADPRVRYQTS